MHDRVCHGRARRCVVRAAGGELCDDSMAAAAANDETVCAVRDIHGRSARERRGLSESVPTANPSQRYGHAVGVPGRGGLFSKHIHSFIRSCRMGMLRWVVFASAVWSHVSLCVSDPVGAFISMHAAAVGCSRARGKSILYTQHVFSLFGLSAAATRRQ